MSPPSNATPTPAAELDALLASSPSPFSDAVLPNAFRDTPDVPIIHRTVRDHLLALIARTRAEAAPAIQAVTGDPGEGKTHLLAWLRRTSEESFRRPDDAKFALAPIAPLRSLDRPFHHVLQEAVWRLAATLPQTIHTDTATDSPIEIILWRALLNVARALVAAPWVEEPLATWLKELPSLRPEKYFKYLAAFATEATEAWPRIEDAFVDAALRLPELREADREIFRVIAGFPRQELRADLVEWLGGAALSPDRLSRLGAGISLDAEAEAWRGLRMLLLLATIAKLPLVLAFDQIEGTERLGDEAVAGFLGALAEIYNEGHSVVLLVFCQTHLWPKLRDLAQLPVRDRLEASPVLHLKALTPEEALALVEKRLEHFWNGVGATPPSPLYPFTTEQVLAQIRGANLRSPRNILRYFQHLARDPGATPPPPPPPPSPLEIVRRKLDSLREEERRTPPRAPEARAGIAQGMVREVLMSAAASQRALGAVSVDRVSQVQVRKQAMAGTQAVVRRGSGVRRVYLEVSNSAHGKSASATAKRLEGAIQNDIADRALLLRESAFPLPPSARDILAELTPRGAILWLRDDDIAPLIALEGLLNAAAAGDIPVAKDVALDSAISVLGEELSLVARIASAAFDDDAPEEPTRAADEETLFRVREYLRTQRAIEALPRLADRVGAKVLEVHAAVQELLRTGIVDIIADRNRVPVVLLRPEKS